MKWGESMLKKVLIVLVIACLVVSLFGCSSNSGEEASEGDQEVTKVALVLGGPINDGGFQALAYNGLLRIEDEFENVEISYNENTVQADYEEVFRSYAMQGFDIIIGNGFEFTDIGASVSPDYPDVEFVIISGLAAGDNLATFAVDNAQVGFLAGAIAGNMTESNIIGEIGGVKIPPIELIIKGYAAGAKYVNPEVEVLATYSGTFEDSNSVKEIAIAMIENGADVLLAEAGYAELGAIEAVTEHNKFYIGANSSKFEIAPDHAINSVLVDGGRMFTYIYELYLAGNLEGKIYDVGINEEVIALDGWHNFEDQVSDEMKAEIEDIFSKVADSSIDYMALTNAVVTE
jgi:basic membrane protein A